MKDKSPIINKLSKLVIKHDKRIDNITNNLNKLSLKELKSLKKKLVSKSYKNFEQLYRDVNSQLNNIAYKRRKLEEKIWRKTDAINYRMGKYYGLSCRFLEQRTTKDKYDVRYKTEYRCKLNQLRYSNNYWITKYWSHISMFRGYCLECKYRTRPFEEIVAEIL